jgi:MFS family permease
MVITILSIIFTLFVSASSSSYNLGFPSMIPALNCTQFEATLGLGLYALGFGVTPLVTAAFSEETGRRPLYLVSAAGFGSMCLAIALARNIQTVLAARFLQGAFGSTGATMVGGTIADIWPAKQ